MADRRHSLRLLELRTETWQRELPDLNLTPFRISVALLEIADQIEQAFGDVARRDFGIGPGDLRILLALRRSGPDYALRPTELVEALTITSGAVTKQVDRLVALGMVSRTPAPGGPRGARIHLEPRGAQVAEEAMKIVCSSFCGLQRITLQQATDLFNALQPVENALNPSGRDHGASS